MLREPVATNETSVAGLRPASEAEREEMTALGLLSPSGELLPPRAGAMSTGRPVPRRAISAHQVLNEAYAYAYAYLLVEIEAIAVVAAIRHPPGH